MGEMSIRVLVVDDDEDMRATLMGFISRLGVKVSTAGSIADAEHALHGQNPPFDLMMTDLSIRFHNYGDVIFRTRKNADGARTVRVQTRPGFACVRPRPVKYIAVFMNHSTKPQRIPTVPRTASISLPES